MNIVKIRKDTIYYQDSEYKLEDLYTSDYYKYSDLRCDDFKNDSILVNSLFEFVLQPFLAVSYFLNNKNIDEIDINGANIQISSLFCDYAISHHIHIRGSNPSVMWSRIRADFLIIASTLYLLYLMLRIPQTEDMLHEKIFSILRSKAAKSKMRKFTFRKEFEDPKDKKSVYRFYGRIERVKWVLSACFLAIKELMRLRGATRGYAGLYTTILLDNYCSKRLVHAFLYAKLIDRVFSDNRGATFYTGNVVDRFSVIEGIISKKYNICIICIPHGMEYGYKLPRGLSADVFYTTSEKAKDQLRKLYNTDKFIFDEEIVKKMFLCDVLKKSDNHKIVFFTEPREWQVNINIIDRLLPLLEKNGLKLNLKLHPKDDINNYKKFKEKVSYIDNLEEALCNNICFARKSTTLIEAFYNGSCAAAIITCPKDYAVFSTFPSLQDSNISVFYNIEDLFKWIVDKIKLNAISC